MAVWVRFGFQLGSLEIKCSGLHGEPYILHSVEPICPISHLWLSEVLTAGAPVANGAFQEMTLNLVPLGPLGPDPVLGIHKKNRGK